jgi:hypothetical protein
MGIQQAGSIMIATLESANTMTSLFYCNL